MFHGEGNWNLAVAAELVSSNNNNNNSEKAATMTHSNVTSASGEAASVSSAQNNGGGSTGTQPAATPKRKRNLPGMPDPDAEVIALSPKTLMATNRFVCEICNKGFQRDQNLQLHRRGHNLPWKLRQRTSKEIRKRVYICPEPNCVHHDPSRALGDLTGIKKHFCRKHGEKKWKCDKCSKRYAVQSDWKAHSKTCGTREYRCDCGTLFSRRDSFITHRAFCDALAEESAKVINNNAAGTVVVSAANAAATPNSSSSEGANRCPPVSVESSSPVVVSSGVAPMPLPAATPMWVPASGTTSGGPKLSLWLGPGPGGPGPPNPSQIIDSSTGQFNAALEACYPYPAFLMCPSNSAAECSASPSAPLRASEASAASTPMGLFGAGGRGAFGISAPGIFTGGFSELMGSISRSSAAATAGISPLFGQASPSAPQSSAAQMSATALLQKAAQMGATTSGNSGLLRSLGASTSVQSDGSNSSSFRQPTESVLPASTGGMQELMHNIWVPSNLTSLLHAPLMKDEEKPTLDLLGIGARGLSHTDLSAITAAAAASSLANQASNLPTSNIEGNSSPKAWNGL
eukprot:TRINITY_DN5692_c0_g1_i1.p1 TRINITY_DN5692_c0_g1~~TRINITY_DN5692_c0_g1_i1.p1  ORF type:complete len:573 (+),score=25.53 TRINITY_DN5692_c0_g1_i1:1114-2832(+)